MSLAATLRAAGAQRCACRHAFSSAKTQNRCSTVMRSAAGGAPPNIPPEVLNNPEFQARMKAMQEAMARPEVQQQMQQMQQMMTNPQLQQRLQELREDPELADIFKELQTGGLAALQKFWNDPKVLAKFGEKMGDINLEGGAAAAAAQPQAPPQPEISTIVEAARFGDIEAIEDFLAIGKDVNSTDNELRTPLHFAVAYARVDAAQLLISSGANLEAQDSKQNTPLHYAAGYGREKLVEMLIEAGANITAKNGTGKTPADLAKLDERNPISQNAEVLAKLGA